MGKLAVAEKGQFEFKNVPIGNYILKVSSLGYETVKKKIKVLTNEITKVSIQPSPKKNILDEVVIIDQ